MDYFLSDLLKDEETYATPTTDGSSDDEGEEDLHEGGDYHLKSALRTPENYEKNWIFRKEKRRLLQELMVNDSSRIDQIGVQQFVIAMTMSETKGCFLHDIGRQGGNRFDITLLSELIFCEIGATCKDLVGLWSYSTVNAYLQQIFSDMDRKLFKANALSSLLVVFNSIKTARQTEIVRYVGFDSVIIHDTHISVKMSDSITIHMNTDIFVIISEGSAKWCPKDYFLNAVDKFNERTNIELYSRILEVLHVPNVPPLAIINKVIEVGDSLLDKFGNTAYDTIANYEALAVGSIIKRDSTGNIYDPHYFLREIVNTIENDHLPYVNQWLDLFDGLDIEVISDLHGLYRIWGHPVVDVEGGMKKMRDVARHEKVFDDAELSSLNRKFKESFVTSYHQRHGFYPPIEVIGSGYIQERIKSGTTINRDFVSYDLEDWDNIDLKKTFEVPVSWNIVHLAKDKAISPTRGEIFDSLTTKRHIYGGGRRGIMKMMSSSFLPMRRFLEQISKNGLSSNDCIIGIYPKERELKIKARLFSLMSFNMRLYFVATEELLGDKILPYFPQITMSLNLLDMQRKMGSMSKKTNVVGESLSFVINMDFVKWNLQMRWKSCHPVFKELDKLFGMDGLFDRTHKIFKNSVIYLCSGEGTFTPDPVYGLNLDGVYSWTGDESGKEGLRQKGWTIMTEVKIDEVCGRHSCEYQLVGGGDNQVLVITFNNLICDVNGNITISESNRIKSELKDFMDDLSRSFMKIGLPLKMSETWVSSSLFMYNKHMYYQGRSLRSVLKPISRAFPLANSSLMTVEGMLSSIGSSLKMASMKERFPHGLVFFKVILGSMVANLSLITHPLCFQLKGSIQVANGVITRSGKMRGVLPAPNWREKFLMNCLYLPTVLGGPGLLNILGLMIRGFPDPLTEHLSLMKKMGDLAVTEKVRRHIYHLRSFSRKRNVEYAKLIEDPASVNHDAPTHGTNDVRQLSRNILLNNPDVKNREFQALLGLLNREMESRFYQTLCSGRCIDPKVMNEIAGASLFGYINSLASRIDQTKTLRKLSENIRVVRTVIEGEISYISYLSVRDNIKHDIEGGIRCSAVLADQIRLYGWGKQILGITVPHPIEFLQSDISIGHSCDNDCLLVRYDNESGERMFTTQGTGKQYMGSYTKEKFKMTDVAAAYGQEDVLSKAIKVQKLINWRYPQGSFMASVIQGVVRAVTNSNPDKFIRDAEEVKGEFDHRRGIKSDRPGGIPNFITNPTSHFSIVTSTWSSHSRGGKNENIHFQACIVWVGMLSMMRRWKKIGSASNVFCFHDDCPTCISEVYDPDPSLTMPSIQVDFPTMPGNQYVYVAEEDIELDHHTKKTMELGQRLTDISHIDDVVIQDLGVSEMTMILILSILGSKVTTESFLSLARDRINPKMVLPGVLGAVHIINLMNISGLEVRSTRALDIFFCTNYGLREASNVFNEAVTGGLECGIHLPEGEIRWASRKVDLIKFFHVNLHLPAVQVQFILSILGNNPFFLSCSRCLSNLRRLFNHSELDNSGSWKCESHTQVALVPSRIFRIHSDLIIKACQNDDLIQINIPVVTCNFDIRLLSREVTLYSDRTLSISPLSLVDPWLSPGGMALLVCGLMTAFRTRPMMFMLNDRIEMFSAVIGAAFLTKKDDFKVGLFIDSFSGKDSTSFYDNKSLIPMKYRDNILCLRSIPVQSSTIIIVAELFEKLLEELGLSNDFFILSGIHQADNIIKRLAGRVQCYTPKVRIDNNYVLLIYFNPTFKTSCPDLNFYYWEFLNSTMDMETSALFKQSLNSCPLPMKIVFRRKGYLHWAVWDSRFELIKVVGILKKRLFNMGIPMRRKQWLMRSQKLLGIFISSLFAHSDHPELANNVVNISLVVSQGIILLKLDPAAFKSQHFDWCSYFRSLSPTYPLSSSEILNGINIFKHRSVGLNIFGN